jgi:hypothetical protein
LADIYDRQLERDMASGSGQSDKVVSRYQLKTHKNARTQAQNVTTCYGNASGLGATNSNEMTRALRAVN